MPYILKKQRAELSCVTNQFKVMAESQKSMTSGELNYLITSPVHAFIKINGQSYSTYNDAVGALECAKLELYRRKVLPYEELKISENGDL